MIIAQVSSDRRMAVLMDLQDEEVKGLQTARNLSNESTAMNAEEANCVT